MKKDIVTAEIDEVDNILKVTWNSLFDDEIFKECCLNQLEKINSETTIILDFKSITGLVSNNINLWLIEIFLPKVKKINLKEVIIIEPEEIKLRETFKNWLKIGENIPESLVVISNIENVKELISNNK